MYLAWSILAAFLMATCGYFRTLESETPFACFYVLAFSYLLISSLALSFLKWHLGPKEFRMSWNKPITEVNEVKWVFSKLHFLFVTL